MKLKYYQQQSVSIVLFLVNSSKSANEINFAPSNQPDIDATKKEMQDYLSLKQTETPNKLDKSELSAVHEENIETLSKTDDNLAQQDALEEMRKKMQKPEKLHPLYSKEEFGRIGWTLLHMYSAFYPENPTKKDQTDMKNFLFAFAKFYPCKCCGSHFAKILREYPIQAESRAELMDYICKMHNLVNVRTKKPEVPCELVGNIWGQKDCGCKVGDIVVDDEKDKEIEMRKNTMEAEFGKTDQNTDK